MCSFCSCLCHGLDGHSSCFSYCFGNYFTHYLVCCHCLFDFTCFILLLIFICYYYFLLLAPCYKIMPYYDANTMYMLHYYIYYLYIVKLVTIITSASAYIHNKCHLLLTQDWLQYGCCIGHASHSSSIINITTKHIPGMKISKEYNTML